MILSWGGNPESTLSWRDIAMSLIDLMMSVNACLQHLTMTVIPVSVKECSDC